MPSPFSFLRPSDFLFFPLAPSSSPLIQIRQQVDALRDAVEKQGRTRDSVKVLIKILVIVDETDEKAKAKEAEYTALGSSEGAKVLFGG